MEKLNFKYMAAAVLAVFVSMFCVKIDAYYDKGPVKISLGDTSVSIREGESVSVSVEVIPSQEEQLPGCGMAQCPQECGEGCVDENGQCQCSGLEYQTYYAAVTAASNNASIAEAEYLGGMISIRGISPGEAAVTVTGGMRQYTDSSEEIRVTVTSVQSQAPVMNDEPQKPIETDSDSTVNNSSGEDQKEDSGKGRERNAEAETEKSRPDQEKNTPLEKSSESIPGAGGAIEKDDASHTIAEDDAEETEKTAAGVEDDSNAAQDNICQSHTRLDTPMGTVYLIELTGQTDIEKELNSIKGKDITATFQKKDSNGNVLYSWSFNGLDIKDSRDIDMSVSVSDTPWAGKSPKARNPLYISFAYDGELPGKSTVHLKTYDRYEEESLLYLYRCNKNSGDVTLASEGIKVQNGYAAIEIDHCSYYMLSAQPVGGAADISAIMIVLLAAALIAGAAAAIFIIKRKSTGRN